MIRTFQHLALGLLLCSCDTFSPPGDDNPGEFGVSPRGPTRAGGSTFPGVSSTSSGIAGGAASSRAGVGGVGVAPRDAGGSGGSGPGEFDDDASEPFAEELTAACSAPLPTGYCIERLGGTQTGGSNRSSGSAVTLTNVSSNEGNFQRATLMLSPDASIVGSGNWTFSIGTRDGEDLAPGMYEPATNRISGMADGHAQLSLSGSSVVCGDGQLGRFRVDELATDDQGKLSRLSAVFETRCSRDNQTVRGVVHFQATGTPDPTLAVAKTINLDGDISRLAYAPATQRAYGLDATARRIASIDLTAGEAKYVGVVQVPDAACVDEKRSRLVVVNKGSSIISEYGLPDLTVVREFSWPGQDLSPATSHFQVHCAGDKLYLVDAAMKPGLFVVEDLGADPPKVVDHSAQISGIAALAFKADHSELYAWFHRVGSSSNGDSPLRRYAASDLGMRDQVPVQTDDPFTRSKIASPLLLDETRNLLIARSVVFDALNLGKRVFTLPEVNSLWTELQDSAQALDTQRGLLATRRSVYELQRYERVSRTLSSTANQVFFDKQGQLWFLNTAKRTLRAQTIATKP